MSIKRATKQRLLAGVGTTVLATMVAGGAFAANTDVDFADSAQPWLLEATATGHVTGTSNDVNLDNVSAAVIGATITHTVESGASETSGTVNANSVSALATGNAANGTIDLSTIDSGVADGIAALQVSTNAGAAVSSEVNGSQLGSAFAIDSTPNVGTYEVIGNTISATTTLNSTTMAVSDEVPTTYNSATAGQISFDYDGGTDLADSTGSMVVTSVQGNLGSGAAAGSGATVANNTISLALAPDDDAVDGQIIASSPKLDGNTSSASYTGNNSVSKIGIDGGGNPSYAGSAVVTSIQGNIEGGAGNSAVNTGTTIAASIGENDDIAIMLDGSLSVSDNTISSAATGNSNSSASDFGNQIVLESGLGYSGDGSTGSSAELSFDGGNASADVAGGLALLSSQSNVDSEHNSLTSGAAITATVDQYEIGDETGGTVTMTNNAISSAATGNSGRNRILAPGLGGSSTTSFDGSAVVASAQTNYGSRVAAGVSAANVLLTVGDGLGTALNDGTAVLDGNSIGASAIGNTVVNALVPSATSVTLGSTDGSLAAGQGATVTGGHVDDGQIRVDAGASLANLQANDTGSPVSATISGARIGLNLATQDTAGADIDNSTLRNTNGTIAASATANNATNTLGVEGTSIAGSAGLGNVQVNHSDATDGSADVSASVSGAGFDISRTSTTDTGEVANSTVDLSNNVISATAKGSIAANGFTVDGNSISTRPDGVDDDTLAASTITLDGLAIDDGTGSLPHSNATFALLNSQGMEGDVAAQVTGGNGPLRVDLGDVEASNVSLDDNGLAATAYANEAASSLSINASAMLGVDGSAVLDDAYGAVASLTSSQLRTDNSDVTANVSSAATDSFHLSVADITGDSDADTSSLSVSGNTIVAEARGNVISSNAMTVTGNQISAVPTTAEADGGMAGLTYDSNGAEGTVTADAAFTVQNVQSGGTGDIAATQTGTGALLEVGNDVSASNLLMEANGFGASASDNLASNSLSFDATSISASGGVQNVQLSSGDVVADLGQPGAIASSPSILTENLSLTPGAGSGDIAVVNAGGGDWTFQMGSSEDSIVIDASNLTDEDRDALENVLPTGFSYDSVNKTYTYDSTVTLNLSQFTGNIATDLFGNLQSTTFTGFSYGGSAGSPASPSVIASIGGDIQDSTVSVIGSIGNASALGNQASNALTATGNSITGGAVIDQNEAGATLDEILYPDGEGNQNAQADYAVSNVQVQGEEGSSFAEAVGTYAIEATVGDGGSAIADSALSVDGTRQSATARGNVAGNALTLDATQTDGDGTGTASAAIASEQVTAADGAIDDAGIHATGWMSVSAPAAIDGSTLSMSDNWNTATATANQVSNTLSASGNSLATARDEAATVDIDVLGAVSYSNAGRADLTVVSDQSSFTDVLADATTSIVNQDAIDPGSNGDPLDTVGISNSTALIEGNQTVATARGNWGGSTIGVDGGASVTAMASLGSSQNRDAVVKANADAKIGFILMDEDGTAVSNSTVGVNGNLAQARALGNDAANEVSVSASGISGDDTGDASAIVTALAAPVVDAQGAYVLGNAQIGTGAVSGTSNLEVTGTLTGGDGGTSGSAIDASTVSFDSNVSRAEAWGNTADNLIGVAAGATAQTTAALQNLQMSNGPVGSDADLEIDVDAASTGNQTLLNGTLSVDGNQAVALTVVNDATNTVSATGANLLNTGAADNAYTAVSLGGVTPDLSSTADYASLSLQMGGFDATANANALITVGLDQSAGTVGGVIDNSTLTIGDNVTVAESRGNMASNSVSTGDITNGSTANIATTSALLNGQVYDDGNVTANSGSVIGLDTTGDVASDANVLSSTLTVTGNQTAAIAVSNTATNVSDIRGGNVGGNGTQSTISADSGTPGSESFTGQASHVLQSTQSSDNLTRATATANVSVDLGADLVTRTALNSSTVEVSGNVVVAEARGNQSTNVMNLEGTSTLGATGAVGNIQYRDGTVTANANGVAVSIAANGYAPVNLASLSTISLTDNSTSSVARGNSSTNALNVTAGGSYGTPSAGASATTNTAAETAGATAAYTVLNGQWNDGGVTANTNGGSYRVALNGGGLTSGSTVMASNNSFSANAAGNSAANSLSLSTLPSGNATAALSSTQVNTGPIMANVTGTSITVSGTGFGTSSVGVNGNTISANAVGNSVSNAIRRK